MDFRDLECLVALAETTSFTRAAERLHMAQPPLSRRIAALEGRLGVALVRRERPIVLTEAGRFLSDQGRQLLARLRDVEDAARRLGAERRRYFGVGFVGSTLYGALPRAIRFLRERHPDVEVGLLELTTAEQRAALQERRIDVGFGRVDLGETPGLTREVIADEPLFLACSPDHPLATAVSATLAEAGAHQLVLYPGRPRPSYADQVLAIFYAAEVTPRVAIEATDLQAALGLVAAGIGITLVPASVAAARRADLACVPIAAEGARSAVIVTYRSGERPPLLRTFLELLRASDQ